MGSFILMAGVMGVMTLIWEDYKIFSMILGSLSSIIEAGLGLPQVYLNHQRKNTQGLSPILIGLWLWGDFYKSVYYIINFSPA